MRFKPPKHSAAFFALIILIVAAPIVGSMVRPGHASSPISFIQKVNANNDGAGGTSLALPGITVVSGDTLVVNIFGVGSFNGFAMTDTQGNTYTQRVVSITSQGAGSSSYIWTAAVGLSGSDTLTITTGGATRIFGATLAEYRNVAGIGVTATYQNDNAGLSGTSTVTLTGTGGAGSVIIEAIVANPGTGTVTFTNSNGQTVRDSGTGPCFGSSQQGCEYTDYPAAATSFSLIIMWSQGGPANCPSCTVSQSALELTGSAGQSIVSINQCYGNCGSPAVTLANTNSTKTVNFNQSITLFYQFQPTIAGFLLNVTTNLAGTLSNSLRSPYLAYYTANCQVGVSPGTTNCPFIQNLGSNTAATSKGPAFIAGGVQYPFTAGEWIAIAVSAQLSGLALNDTNTTVQMYQTSGIISGAITQASVYSASSKIGLWAWIQGNVVGSLPPPTPAQGTCFGLDCILANVVNSFCQNVTTACQTSSSMFWAVILTILSIGVTAYFLNQTLPGLNLGRLGLGELGVLIFVMWIAIFTSFNLMSLYVLAIVFSIVAILMGKRVQGMI